MPTGGTFEYLNSESGAWKTLHVLPGGKIAEYDGSCLWFGFKGDKVRNVHRAKKIEAPATVTLPRELVGDLYGVCAGLAQTSPNRDFWARFEKPLREALKGGGK